MDRYSSTCGFDRRGGRSCALIRGRTVAAAHVRTLGPLRLRGLCKSCGPRGGTPVRSRISDRRTLTVSWGRCRRPAGSYRSVRVFVDKDGGWRRYEAWITTLGDADTGRVLGVVGGRDSAGVGSSLAARSHAWRTAVEVVAIAPWAAFRKAPRERPPVAAVSVDSFHLANAEAVTAGCRVVTTEKPAALRHAI